MLFLVLVFPQYLKPFWSYQKCFVMIFRTESFLEVDPGLNQEPGHCATEKLKEQNTLRFMTPNLEFNAHVESMVIIVSTYSDINISNFLRYICRLLNHLLTNEYLSMLFSCSDGRHNDRLLITTSSYILVLRRMRTRIPRAAKQCRSGIYYSFKTHVKPFLRPS